MRHFKPELPLCGRDMLLERTLLSGGDMRLAVDPSTGRNMYRVPPRPENREIWLSSSTASPITKRGFDAAAQAFERWTQGSDSRVADWSASVRKRLLRLFGVPGAEVVLCPSGTDAEMLVLALALDRFGSGVTNIVLAPGETGRGVPLAAAGYHTSSRTPLGAPYPAGKPSDPAFCADVEVETVDIRESDGCPRSHSSMDARVYKIASQALRRGRGVILHCLDVSKTGLSAVPSSTITTLAVGNERCLVVLDACQLRCPAQRIRDALAANQIVIVTGSKFAGGPPFSGAVFLPRELASRLAAIRLPDGMGDYSALTDWPPAAHATLRPSLGRRGNPGLLLRWEAALAELEPFCAVPRTISDIVAAKFAFAVTEHVLTTRGLSLLDHRVAVETCPTIVPIVTSTCSGRPSAGALVQAGLAGRTRRAGHAWQGRAFRLGQPVAIGRYEPIRVCLSAPQLTEIAHRVQTGETIDRAFAPFDALLSDLFAKWAWLAKQVRDDGSAFRQ